MNVRPTTALALRALARDVPLELTVSGRCMIPSLESGERIEVAGRAVYLPGDIVAFRRRDDRLLVHRVLGYTLTRDGLCLLAKGDRLAREDEPVPLRDVVGRVVAARGTPYRASRRQRWSSSLRFLGTLVRRAIRPWVSATSS